MRHVAFTAAAVVALLVGGPPASAAPWAHTRPISPGAAELVTDAARSSAIARSLLEALERTDVVVYVSDHVYASATEPQAHLRWVSCAGGLRYVLVEVGPWETVPIERIAWLGHELTHALEVAAAPDVVDEQGLARLYGRIGWNAGDGQFESDAARLAGDLIRDELAGFTVPSGLPPQEAPPPSPGQQP